MQYTKPHITNTEHASFAIMNTGGQKEALPMVDNSLQNTIPAYSADE
jgi:hypothetical protein